MIQVRYNLKKKSIFKGMHHDHPFFYKRSGATIRRLMRQMGVTIRELSQVSTITQKRIRQIRKDGTSGSGIATWEILYYLELAQMSH